MNYCITLIAALVLSACGGTMSVLLVHPKTGERIICRGSGYHPVIDVKQARDCASQYESLGFVRPENLSPDQRDGLVSKPTAARIEQDITVRQTPSKTP